MPRTHVCVRVRPADLDSKGSSVPAPTKGHYEVDSIHDAASSSQAELFTQCCLSTAVSDLVEACSSLAALLALSCSASAVWPLYTARI
jgi:hypothetical protein